MTTMPEERKYSALYLKQMLISRHPDHFMFLVDLFAVGCILHLQGECAAGQLLVARALHAVADPASTSYTDFLLKSLSGNEISFIRDIDPSPALRALCERRIPARFTEAACAR